MEVDYRLGFGKIKYNIPQKDEVLASTNFRNLLPIQYLDTDAGSNPREFQGMTPVNIKILKSMIKNPKIFWAKHSQVILTIKGGYTGKEGD